MNACPIPKEPTSRVPLPTHEVSRFKSVPFHEGGVSITKNVESLFRNVKCPSPKKIMFRLRPFQFRLCDLYEEYAYTIRQMLPCKIIP